ncbi:hypothetical protein V7654_15145 [Bacillus sp. JJ1609]|uniref:hypothetical protein n=1 Tax=Bacillus sp. JJ1609 TaxID=3122977 RepID=UPI003000B993
MVHPFVFFGGKHYQENEAHEILNNFFEQILEYFTNNLGVDVKNYSNINELVNSQPEDNNADYFWSWMKNSGLDLINKVLCNKLSQSEEFLDLLDHRVFVLEMDIDSGIKGNVYHSFAESLKVISEAQETFNQTSAATQVTITNGTKITEVIKVTAHPSTDFIWVNAYLNENLGQSWNNPAETQRDFCYYMGEE